MPETVSFWDQVCQQFDRAAALTGHPPGVLEQIRSCDHVYRFAFPVRRDDGRLEVLHGWRARPQGVRLYRANGCAKCDRTGYRGRMALYELLVADATIKRMVQTRAPVNEIAAAAAAAGTRSLKQDGIDKMLLGLTDLPQVRTV